ncbi:MAG: PrgI family protein [Candidatus Dormibacteria bacterium]
MSQVQVHQPISHIPARWGAFTAPQLAWIAIGCVPGYVLLRLGLATWLVGMLAAPALVGALLLAFGRREGRPLDSWVGDWLVYQWQPHRLCHPALAGAPSAAPYQRRQTSASPSPLPAPLALDASLPWSPP